MIDRSQVMRRLAAVGAAVVVAGGGVAACSSSASSSAPSATHTATGTSADSGLSAAKAFVGRYEAVPTSIGDTTLLPKAPPKGITIAFPENDNPQTQYETDGFRAATMALGWKLDVIPYQLANAPGSFLSAMQTALQMKPYAVIVVGNPEAIWQSLIPSFAAAHVYIIPSDSGPITKASPWILPQFDTPADSALEGEIVANKFVAASGGTGQAVLVNVPDIPVLAEGGAAIQSTVAQNCPACKLTTLNISLTQFVTDGGVSDAVSALQRNPNAKYLLTEQGVSDQGVPSALSAAGLTGVQLIGFDPSTTALEYAKNNTALGFATISFGLIGFMGIDIAAQKLTGVADPSAGAVPIQLLTQSTLASMNPIPPDIPLPVNYAAQYEKKWLVG